MKNLKVNRTIAAPRSHVWAVLADYPNIQDWNEGVQKSYALGDLTEGVGAQRQCELTPAGSMRETVAAWEPESKMVIDLDNIEKVPLKRSTMTFTLTDTGDTTGITMSYDFEPKGGPFAFLVAAILRRPMNKGFNAFVDNLQTEAQTRTSA